MSEINAQDLIRLLSERHAKDVFVPECKDGPTWGGSHFRLDAWAMRKSWSSPCVWGYEVKVSRSDFVRDDKWQAYLPTCNELYFVAPPGMIEPRELSADVGLIVCSAHGQRLYTKKKAAYRALEIPEPVYRYILMNRVQIKTNAYDPARPPAAEWRAWLAQKSENRRLGCNVSRTIRQTVDERIEKVERENHVLQKRMETYDGLRQWLKSKGIDAGDYAPLWSLTQQLERATEVLPPGLLRSLQTARTELGRAEAELLKLVMEGRNT